MNKLLLPTLLLSLVALYALPGASQAQFMDAPRLHVGMGIGIGGEGKAEVDTPIGDQDFESDMKTTLGPRLGVEVPLHTYFTLGGELGLAFWSTDADDDADRDRQLNLDVALRPKLRLPLAQGFEAYAVLPIGYSHYFPRDHDDGVDGGPGFVVGGLAGGTFLFTDTFGINAELGYLYRKFNSSVDLLGNSYDAKNHFGQFQINLGALLAF